MSRIVVVGDVLLDRDVEGDVTRVCPDAPAPVLDERRVVERPGGAGLAARMLADDGHEVTLVTALADDDAGRRLLGLLDRHVHLVVLRDTGTTREKVRLRARGTSLVRLDRGRGGPLEVDEHLVRAVVRDADAVLASDYAGGVLADPRIRAALEDARPATPVVWDPHPRGPRPTRGVTVVTPNAAEVRALVELRGSDDVDELARALARQWEVTAVAVTMGERGALLCYTDGLPVAAPAPAVSGGDPCGAGDRFASAMAARLAGGAVLSEAVADAVEAASAFVAAGGAARLPQVDDRAAPDDQPDGGADDAVAVVERVRRRGGTVVATGGCFDLLHAGHVGYLQSARALGDCLVVLLNSDASVRRLKGPGRPLVPEEDRARVLQALDCVDRVVVFDEDTPQEALAGLRPDVWVKGGDYGEEQLPEAALVRSWGGRVVLVPFLPGRSTSRLIGEAATRAAGRI